MSRKSQQAPGGAITDEEVEERIREFFDRNYELLRHEGGHVWAEGARRQALEQALLYWRKLKAIATSVTRTEEKLRLRDKSRPRAGRLWSKASSISYVRGPRCGCTTSRRTKSARCVRRPTITKTSSTSTPTSGKESFARGSTELPLLQHGCRLNLRERFKAATPRAIREAMDAWQPVVDLPFDEEDVDRTIRDFGRCVDNIERRTAATTTRETQSAIWYATTSRSGDLVPAPSRCRRLPRSTAETVMPALAAARTALPERRNRTCARPTASAGSDDETDVELDAWIEENLADS